MKDGIMSIDNIKNIADLFIRAKEKWHDKTAYIYKDKTITFGQLYDHIRAHMTVLSEEGFSKGQKAALVCENCYEWIVNYFAVISMGGIIVPFDSELGAEAINALAYKYGITHIICQSNLKERYDDSHAVILVTDELSKKRDNAQPADIVKADEDSICQITFTSGTTGNNKAVPLTQKNLIDDIISVGHCVDYGENERALIILPMYHLLAITASILFVMYRGGPLFISASKKTFMRDLMMYQPQWMACVPAIAESLYKVIVSGGEKYLSVLSGINLVCGGAELPVKLDKFLNDVGFTIYNGYGITECSPIISVRDKASKKYGCVGRPLDCCQVMIVSPDENGDGEILIKGSNVFSGYLDDADNEGAFSEGWFCTGDIGRLDSDGELYISGRIKNLIILDNGKNVASEEIERLIAESDAVTENIVYASEGMITVEIYSETEQTEEAEKFIEQLNAKLPVYKRIRKVVFTDKPFEKTATMKIKRRKK